jgi:hypothetical protein
MDGSNTKASCTFIGTYSCSVSHSSFTHPSYSCVLFQKKIAISDDLLLHNLIMMFPNVQEYQMQGSLDRQHALVWSSTLLTHSQQMMLEV